MKHRKLYAAMATLLALTSLVCLILPLVAGKAKTAIPLTDNTASQGGNGIVSISWKQRLQTGERLSLQGTWYNASGDPVKATLYGYGRLLDSALLPVQGKERFFDLGFIPAHAGRAICRLLVVREAGGRKDTLENEPVPVEVLPVKSLKVLFLASSPDFEHTFLSGWLSRNGHSVWMRTAVSKDKYQMAYLNAAPAALDHLSPALLGRIDLLITDAAALQAMAPGELALLRREVEANALGLITRVDTNWVKETPGMQPLIRDSLSHVLAGVRLSGAGKIVETTLHGTYSRLLAGDSLGYASLWSLLIQQVIKKADRAETWATWPAVPRVNESVQVTFQSARPGLPQGVIEGPQAATAAPGLPVTTLYLSRHPYLPFLWQGSWWPREEGWQSVHASTGDTSYRYVWGEHDWKNLYGYQQGQINRAAGLYPDGQRMPGDSRGPDGEPNSGGADREPIPKGWPFAIFVLSCCYLWIEKKLYVMGG